MILPNEVEVTIAPLEAGVTRGIALELAAATGSEIGIEVIAVGLERTTGVAFELTYDPTLLEFTGAGPGTFFSPAGALGANVVESTPGRLVGVAAAIDQQVGRDGGGTLLTLQFRLTQLRDAQSTLVFARPQSLVYGPEGVTGGYTFGDARLVTRIRAPR